MELSRQIAEKIVAEVNNVIPQKINLMDPRGVIIASSDPARVGSFHEGAYRIVSEGLPEVVVHRDGEYAGALRGLNFPIVMEGRILGVLGKVISSTSMVEYITTNADVLSAIGIFFPFLLAAILKCAQGSSTVAITTTAGIMAPMMGALGLGTPVLGALTVIAIGAGAMTVSHANDSYFWVVTNFGEMKVEDGYKTQTLGTLVIGLASMVGVFIAWMFLH